MRISNLFPTTKEGIQAMTLEEYVGLLKNDESIPLINSYNLHEDTWVNAHIMINKAHTFLTQELREDMLVRPEEPKKKFTKEKDIRARGTYFCSKQATDQCECEVGKCNDIEDYLAWQNWKPLFAGEWRIGKESELVRVIEYLDEKLDKFVYLDDCKTLNDFIRESNKEGIKLYFLDREI